MSNMFVKDPYVKVLLDRREELKQEINKLDAEYQAIGELLLRNHSLTQNKKTEGEER